MELICPNCSSIIDADNINVMTDLAKCNRCGSLHKASTLAGSGYGQAIENPPKGSKISLRRESGDVVSIELPAKGFQLSTIPQLIFAVFWVGFIGFWTAMASQAGFFAFFSIPFWLVGILMWSGLIISVAEKQSIKVGRGKITITKSRLLFSKVLDYNFSDIHEIALKSSNSSFSPYAFRFQQSRYAPPPEMPALISGSGTKYFFEGANDAEKSWIVKYLNQKLAQSRR